MIVARGEGGVSPLAQVGGLSLLTRAVLTAQRAGATTCYILAPPQNTAILQAELRRDSRVTAELVWEGIQTPRARPWVERAGVCALFPVNRVFRHPFLRELAARVTQRTRAVVATTDGVPGVIVASHAVAAALLLAMAQDDSWDNSIAHLSQDEVCVVPVSPSLCVWVTHRASVVRAERALLSSLENARDGVVDRYFNRRLSRPLSRWLLRTPLRPNHVTCLSCAVGVLAALCFGVGGYWGPLLGAFLLQGAAVLDCCDGEIARIKFLESSFGEWLDIICDTVVHLAIFIGIGVAVWRSGSSAHALLLAAILVLGGVLAFPLVTLAEKTEEWGEQRGGWEDVWIKRLLTALTTHDFSVVILASAVLGKLEWFLWGAAIGAHVFWLCLTWLLVRAGRFVRLRHAWERKG